jgi:hypothetical protein
MARGWESKNIESQQEDSARAKARGPELTPDQRLRAARRHNLELARSRAQADLDRATAPAHRSMLEQALDALDAQLREIDSQ